MNIDSLTISIFHSPFSYYYSALIYVFFCNMFFESYYTLNVKIEFPLLTQNIIKMFHNKFHKFHR